MICKRLLIAAVLAGSISTAHAQLAGRLVDAIDVADRQGRVDINLIFGCGLRYLTHSPASEGDTVRIRLVPLADCGDISGALLGPAPAVDGGKIIRSIELEQLIGSQVDMTLRFARAEQFVLAPTADSHGLRIRLLRAQSDRARVFVGETVGPPATYAVNLDSAQQPFDQEALDRATRAAGAPAYVSEFKLGDETWYRLRVGPFRSDADARKVLLAVRESFPKAWVAIGDDETLNSPAGAEAKSPVPPTLPQPDATLTAEAIDAAFAKAKKAFARKDYDTAIPLLTQLLEQPEFPRRAEAQELMGLARERNRQLAHAKAEYEEYVRRYPDGRAVKRIKERLRALALAARPARAGTGAGGADDGESAWTVYGGASQIYRRDSSQLDNETVSTSFTTQNALLNDVDLVARRRGERFDFSTRAVAGYVKDMLADGPGDQTRVSTLFAEFGDRELDWTARLGRQSRNSGGLFGTFDGLYAGYQLTPLLRLNAAFGYPVETTINSPDTGRQFFGLAVDLGTFADAWDLSMYAVSQQLDGNTDRRALGTEVRYFRPGRTLVGLVDYDIYFQELNNVLLLGTVELPARWTLTANLDHRKSPSLSLRNALIGQPLDTFDGLLNLFSRSELEQLALDRTAESDLYSLSVSRPVGERWQWVLDVSSMTLSGTPASAGVQAMPDPGTETAVSVQGIASSLFGGSDLSQIILRHQSGATVDTDSLGLSTRIPLWGPWRVGPRLRVDRRQFAVDGSQQLLYVPTLRIDMQRTRMLLEFEAGAEIGRRERDATREDTTRYYFSLGYRMSF